MKARKLLNPDGTTKKIMVAKDNGSYTGFTPKEAAEMINLLKSQLWSGLPLASKDMR